MMGSSCGGGRGSRGRWRKPLGISMHGKGLEGGSVRREPSVAGGGVSGLVRLVSFRKYFLEAPQNALSRSRSKRRRQKTPHNGPLAPAPQAPHHARAPAEDDPPRSHPSTGAHAPAASSPRARSAGQPIIASRKKALSGRVTAPL